MLTDRSAELARWKCDHDVENCLCDLSAERELIARTPNRFVPAWEQQHRNAAREALNENDLETAEWHLDQIELVRRNRDLPVMLYGPELPIGNPSIEHLEAATEWLRSDNIRRRLSE